MALPTSGALAILDSAGTTRSIAREVCGNATPPKSLLAIGQAVDPGAPYGMLEFYGFGGAPATTNVRWCRPSINGNNTLVNYQFCGCCCNFSFFTACCFFNTSCVRTINQGNTVGFSICVCHGNFFGGGGQVGAGPSCGSTTYGFYGNGGFNQSRKYCLTGISTTGRSCIIFWGCFT